MKDIIKLFKSAFPLNGKTVTIIICMLMTSAYNYILPFLTQRLIDRGFAEKQIYVILNMSILMFILAFLSYVVEYIKEKNRVTLYNKFVLGLYENAMNHITKVKIDFFKDKNSAMLQKIIDRDVDNMSSVVNEQTFAVLTMFISAVSGGVALFRIDFRLGIAVIAFIPLNFFISRYFSEKNESISEAVNEQAEKFGNYFGDTINGIRDVRLTGTQNIRQAKMHSMLHELLDLGKKHSLLGIKMISSEQFLYSVMLTVLYVISGFLLVRGNVSIGGIIAFQAYGLMIYQPIIMGLQMIFETSGIIPSIKRYNRLMTYAKEYSGNVAFEPENDIIFDNVTFRYPDSDKDVFTNISMTIKNGSKNVIIGRNGMGKTTLLDLILRFNTPRSGHIMVGGRDIEEYDIKSYRNNISVVSQNVYLFNTTIRENICLGRDVSNEQLDDVMKAVGLFEFVRENGYGYEVGENGSRLSGGQKQKVALARAIVSDKKIFIFDEATSNVDHITIKAFKELFNTILSSKTVICVSHTDEVICCFDNIIELNKNNIMVKSTA